MNPSEFGANYEKLGDDELLCLWAERNTLVPEALLALDAEVQRRGLRKQDASRVKKRFDALMEREHKGPLRNQVAKAKYERSMRHFVGWKEPDFYSPYTSSRDIRNTFAYIRHSYKVWRAFRDHTGRWPIYSICFYFLSWIAVFGFCVAALAWIDHKPRSEKWSVAAGIGSILVVLAARELGARLMRKLDWKRFGG